MKIKDLKPNEKNPRKISSKDKAELKKAIFEFGDLGSIIYNRTTKRLAGGHQRTSVMPPGSVITIEKKYDTPTKTGTVAEGFVSIDGENFKYREVEWDQERESAAMIAANNHGGTWDNDLLKVTLSDIKSMDMNLTGFDADELKGLGFDLKPLSEMEPQVVNKAEKIESDEEYVKNTPETTGQINQERIPSTDVVTPYEKIEEKTEVVGKKFMIVIECPNQEIKDSLKEKLRPEITQAECKIF